MSQQWQTMGVIIFQLCLVSLEPHSRVCLCEVRASERRKERKTEHVSTAAVINVPFGTAEVNAGSQ